jgi:hypothetical protein
LRPANAANHVDTEAKNDENWDCRTKIEIGASDERDDDQKDDEYHKLEHGTFLPSGAQL